MLASHTPPRSPISASPVTSLPFTLTVFGPELSSPRVVSPNTFSDLLALTGPPTACRHVETKASMRPLDNAVVQCCCGEISRAAATRAVQVTLHW